LLKFSIGTNTYVLDVCTDTKNSLVTSFRHVDAARMIKQIRTWRLGRISDVLELKYKV